MRRAPRKLSHDSYAHAANGAHGFDWGAFAKMLPVGPQNRFELKRLFDRFDVSGRNRLSLAEVDKGLLEVAQVEVQAEVEAEAEAEVQHRSPS